MSQIMSFEEIKRNYDGEWVLISYTETDENFQVIKGKVVAHSTNKEDIYKVLESAKEQPLAIEYIGQIPEDLAFVL